MRIMKSLTKFFLVALLGFQFTACTAFYIEPSKESNFFEHEVRYQGETLAAISRWYTGRSSNWPRIQRANSHLDPRRIRQGDTVLIPRQILRREKPLPKSAVAHRVQPVKAVVLDPSIPEEAETLFFGDSESDETVPLVPQETIEVNDFSPQLETDRYDESEDFTEVAALDSPEPTEAKAQMRAEPLAEFFPEEDLAEMSEERKELMRILFD